jgi:hypothetical protein
VRNVFDVTVQALGYALLAGAATLALFVYAP